MKKRKTIKFIIKERTFKTRTLFVLNCGFKEFAKIVKSYGIEVENLGKFINGMVLSSNDNKYFFRTIWYEDAKDFGGLIHEVFHLVVRICDDKGVPIKAHIETGQCGDETAAYLLEFYTNEVFKKLKINN